MNESGTLKSVPSDMYTEEYFLRVCNGYEEFSRDGFALRIKQCLSYVTIKSGDKVLDAGCGRGDASVLCALAGAYVVGIDYAKDSMKISKVFSEKFIERIGTAGGTISFHRANVKLLPFYDSSFDRIICLDLIEHLYRPEQRRMLAEFKRVLKDDGVLLVHTLPNLLVYKYLYPLLRFLYPLARYIKPIRGFIDTNQYWRGLQKLPKEPRSPYERKMHVAEQTPTMLCNTLKKSGFTCTIKLKFQMRTSRIAFIKVLGLIIENIPFFNKIFCVDIIVVAKKETE
jgi:ubiquinone/menaquinone biosynthesis C-methylase UbiE